MESLVWGPGDEVEGSHVVSSKLHFVDLAGSERAGKTGNRGERFIGQSVVLLQLFS